MLQTVPKPAVLSRDDLSSAGKKKLLRFLTCGSVDDGKSTLIGRLLTRTCVRLSPGHQLQFDWAPPFLAK